MQPWELTRQHSSRSEGTPHRSSLRTIFEHMTGFESMHSHRPTRTSALPGRPSPVFRFSSVAGVADPGFHTWPQATPLKLPTRSPQSAPRAPSPPDVARTRPGSADVSSAVLEWPQATPFKLPTRSPQSASSGPVPTGCGARASHEQTNSSLDYAPSFPRFLVENHQLFLYMCIFE